MDFLLWEEAVDLEANPSPNPVDHLGSVRLQALTPAQLNRFYAALLDKGGRTGKGLSGKTVKNTHVMIHRAFRDAVRWGRVTRNVAELADPPRRDGPR
jgi:hypothetical protein